MKNIIYVIYLCFFSSGMSIAFADESSLDQPKRVCKAVGITRGDQCCKIVVCGPVESMDSVVSQCDTFPLDGGIGQCK